jgi:hypothetical protein
MGQRCSARFRADAGPDARVCAAFNSEKKGRRGPPRATGYEGAVAGLQACTTRYEHPADMLKKVPGIGPTCVERLALPVILVSQAEVVPQPDGEAGAALQAAGHPYARARAEASVTFHGWLFSADPECDHAAGRGKKVATKSSASAASSKTVARRKLQEDDDDDEEDEDEEPAPPISAKRRVSRARTPEDERLETWESDDEDEETSPTISAKRRIPRWRTPEDERLEPYPGDEYFSRNTGRNSMVKLVGGGPTDFSRLDDEEEYGYEETECANPLFLSWVQSMLEDVIAPMPRS